MRSWTEPCARGTAQAWTGKGAPGFKCRWRKTGGDGGSAACVWEGVGGNEGSCGRRLGPTWSAPGSTSRTEAAACARRLGQGPGCGAWDAKESERKHPAATGQRGNWAMGQRGNNARRERRGGDAGRERWRRAREGPRDHTTATTGRATLPGPHTLVFLAVPGPSMVPSLPPVLLPSPWFQPPAAPRFCRRRPWFQPPAPSAAIEPCAAACRQRAA